jgi:serine/threonine-protein kinase
MARLSHANIATVHDVGLFHGQLYVCMELVTGTTLRAWIADAARSWRELVDVFGAAGRGLAYVHRMGLVHLDFKPDNVLVCRTGRVVVTDFGLARVIGGQRPGPRLVVGTPAYMAPEQRRGEATDARTDQFGFCAALREALGDRPAPRWLHRVLARGLAPVAVDRFVSMDALLAAIELGTHRPRRRWLAGLATATAATLAVVASRSPGTVTQLVDRPVVHTIVAPGTAPRLPGIQPIAATEPRVASAIAGPTGPLRDPSRASDVSVPDRSSPGRPEPRLAARVLLALTGS